MKLNTKLVDSFCQKNEITLFRGNELAKVKYSHWIANSYSFKDNLGRAFLLETGCTWKRQHAITKIIKAVDIFGILNTHWHRDHTANNGKIALKTMPIWYHPQAKEKLQNTNKFFLKAMATMFETMDIKGILMRYGFPKYQINLIIKIHQLWPKLAYFLALLNFKKYYGIIRNSFRNIRYFSNEQKIYFSFNKLILAGWLHAPGIIILETPGHTDDSVSYYLKDQHALFIVDLDFFLNPNSLFEGSIQKLHDSLRKIIQLVKNENIEFLGRSHYEPIYGTNNILKHLIAVENKQKLLYKNLTAIIGKEKVWFWEEILKKIFEHKTIFKDILEQNYPNTPSFIDNYIFIFLIENGYKYFKGRWVK